MRLLTILAASALALSAGGAFAQNNNENATERGRDLGRDGVAAATATAPAVNPLREEDVSRIKGTDVYGSDGTKIGDVSTALMNTRSRKINRLVVAEGGVLGVDAHDVALPVDQFHWDAHKGGFRIAKTSDELNRMPEWHDPSRATEASGSSEPPSAATGGATAPVEPAH